MKQLVRRRILIVLGSVVLVLALSRVFAQGRPPEYEATAVVKYEPSLPLSGLLGRLPSYPSSDSIDTQTTLIKSSPVLEAVARRTAQLPRDPGAAVSEVAVDPAALGTLASRITTKRLPDTSVIEISAKSASPGESRELADAVAEAYRDYRGSERRARLAEAQRFLEAQIAEIETRVRAAEEDRRAFRERGAHVVGVDRAPTPPGLDASINEALLALLRSKYQEALILQSANTEEVSIVRAAAEPTARRRREQLSSVVVGTLVGLMLGLVAAFVSTSGKLRGIVVNEGQTPAEVAAGTDASNDNPPRPGRRARRRYRDLWAAGLVVAALLGLTVAGLLWSAGWLAAPPKPRALLRRSLEPPPTPILAVPQAPAAGVQAVTIPAPQEPSKPAPDADSTPLAPTPSTTPPDSLGAAGTASRRAAEPTARFAVEFGPFLTSADAERVERALNEGGYQTVRFRRPIGSTLYAVLIEPIATVKDAQALVATLREQGFAEAVVLGGGDPLVVRVGDPAPLRGAVQLAERLRASGHTVRLATQPGDVTAIVVRHGHFASRSEAEGEAADIGRLGLGSHVVQVR
jgi:cell division protein FtsN/capsular polysaccharide biosynthesis protein